MVEIKFCGLTQPGDAAVAAELGAGYAGVIFAGGPRLVSPERAREVFAPLAGSDVHRVGVFGTQPIEEIARLARAAAVDVVQLHGGATSESIATLRGSFDGAVWAVVRVSGPLSPSSLEGWAASVDAVVLDAAVAGRLGGTGVALDWPGVTAAVDTVRGGMTVVLAGGLRPGNVAEAVRMVGPDIVDVSSGVEGPTPGVKDHELMRAFARSARQAMDEE